MNPVTTTAANAPLPLTRWEAMQRAYELRSTHHLSYPAISRVMGEYHGVWLGEGAWREGCARRGAKKNPNRVAANRRRVAA